MSPKEKITYVCSSCGAKHPKWIGQCNECGIWNSLSKTNISDTSRSVRNFEGTYDAPIDLLSIQVELVSRMSTGFE